MTEECRVCHSLDGSERISPGAPIFDGAHWVLEHAYPTALEGWLVMVLKRHVKAIHDLLPDELAEMVALIGPSAKLLHHELQTEKEYTAIFSEAPGFTHLHVHVIPVVADTPPERRGPAVFDYLNDPPLGADEVSLLTKHLSQAFARVAGVPPARPKKIFHILERGAWPDRSRPYRPGSLDDEGFIHFSTAAQVLRVADDIYPGRDDMEIFTVDSADLGDSLVYQDSYDLGEVFPHVYAPIDSSQVLDSRQLLLGNGKKFTWPAGAGLV